MHEYLIQCSVSLPAVLERQSRTCIMMRTSISIMDQSKCKCFTNQLPFSYYFSIFYFKIFDKNLKIFLLLNKKYFDQNIYDIIYKLFHPILKFGGSHKNLSISNYFCILNGSFVVRYHLHFSCAEMQSA